MFTDNNLDKLLECVPVMESGDGLSSRDIWRRYGLWSPITVKRALNAAALAGKIEREMHDGMWLYRRRP